MDWNHEHKIRKIKVAELRRKLNSINKQIKEIGSTDFVDIIAEGIEREYGYPCVVKSYKTTLSKCIDIYSKKATKKQIQYRRSECVIGSIWVCYYDGKYWEDIGFADEPKYRELPDNIEDILKIAIN